MGLSKHIRNAAEGYAGLDLDYLSVRPVEGGHRLTLQLGLGYGIYQLGAFDQRPGHWVLQFTDCAVASIDEPETLADPCTFDCAPFELELSVPIAIVGLGGRRLNRLSFQAERSPFRFWLELQFEGGALTLSERGPWVLREASGQRVAPPFRADFEVGV